MEGEAQETTTRKNRDSNMELLRILCMLMIVIHHVCVHGKWTNLAIYSPESFIINCLSIGGKIGVDCFVLISGYYLITSERSNYLKIVKLWFSMLFYSVAISVFFIFKYDNPYNSLTIFQMLTPVLNETWWFMSTFIILMIISPLLNKLAHSIDKKTYLSIIIILIVLWSIIPSFTELRYGCSNVLWFALLYMIAGFIRLYPKAFGKRFRLYFFILIVSVTATCASFYIIGNVNSDDPLILFLTRSYKMFIRDYSITTLLISLSLLLIFKNIRNFNSRIVNILASATMGVYLIHDHALVRGKIYNDFFHCTAHYGEPDMVLYCFYAMIVIYCICTVIELVRLYCIEKPFMRIITPCFRRLHERYVSRMESLSEKF